MSQNPPKVIHRLSQEVINKICAGEVIHRPLNVVKELLENSIDAGATQITVTLKSGGLKLITIQDNGSGIRKEDLSIVCNRFTTSKLSNFDDLQNLSTFGFRGEALSSVSTVSHLSIQSRTADSVCGYRAEYFDGDLKPGDGGTLKPVAMNQGTIIHVENLFFNMPTRRQALTSENVEFGLVLDMMERYALLHSGKVSLSLKKSTDSIPVLNTKSTSSLQDNVGQIFGDKISQKLLDIYLEDEKLGFNVQINFTSSDVNLKRMYFILFINNRLVDSNSLKNSVKDLYQKYLMKGGHAFVLLFLNINPHNIDVNVHPTKSEVCFLYENEILEKILNSIEKKLCDRNSSNLPSNNQKSSSSKLNEGFVSLSSKNLPSKSSLQVQQKNMTQSTLSFQNKTTNNVSANTSLNNSLNSTKNRSQMKQIRNDAQISRIDQYLKTKKMRSKVKRREFTYDSLNNLRKDVFELKDENIYNMFKNSTFVGSIDENYFLIQHELNLIMVNSLNVNLELFYQIYLIDFGNFASIEFRRPLCLKTIIGLYFKHNCPELEDVNDKINEVMDILCSKDEMFLDYFSLKINNETKCLETIPQMIENHLPLFGLLPDFLYHLAMNVKYDDEMECFHDIGLEFAKFYSKTNIKNHSNDLIENSYYPLYRTMFYPSKYLSSNDTFVTLTNTSNLYKVFERC